MKRKPYSEMTDQQLSDAAARLMGWRLRSSVATWEGQVWYSRRAARHCLRTQWNPLTNADQLAMVLARLHKQQRAVRSCVYPDSRKLFDVVLYRIDSYCETRAMAPTFPRALLVAALTAIAAWRKGMKRACFQ